MISGELRDVECGLDYARLYDLGCFDREFMVYGVCYWEKNGVHYLVSENPEKIYKFVNRSMLDERYCSDVIKRVIQHNVASGTEDLVKRQIMLDVAKELKSVYGEGYFKKKKEWIEMEASDTAYEMLTVQQEKLEGCFDKARIEMFEALCYHALEHKTLTRIKYDEFVRWIRHIYRQLEDDTIEKDKFKRDFAGFAYIEQETVKWFFDANIVNVWEKRGEKRNEGDLTTPIFSHQYWIPAINKLPQVRKDFQNKLSIYIDNDYLQCVKVATGISDN
mgnify:CR=1 FL=1